MTLEDTIRALAEKGNLSHISLAMNSSHTKWRASYAPARTFGVSFAEDEDPVKAMVLAMGKRPTNNLNPHGEPIKQDTVEVIDHPNDGSIKNRPPTDKYLAGITAKIKPDDDIDALM